VGLVLLGLAALIAVWPWLVALPLAAIGAWTAVTLLIRAQELRAQRAREAAEEARASSAGAAQDRDAD